MKHPKNRELKNKYTKFFNKLLKYAKINFEKVNASVYNSKILWEYVNNIINKMSNKKIVKLNI